MSSEIPWIKNVGTVEKGSRVIKLEGKNEGKHGSVMTVKIFKQELEVAYDDQTQETASSFEFGFEPPPNET